MSASLVNLIVVVSLITVQSLVFASDCKKVELLAGVQSSGGFSGNDGPATSALLKAPSGMWLNDTSKIFICDKGNSRIRLINEHLTIKQFAGSGSASYNGDGGDATSAGISPFGMCGDTQGNIYIVDNANVRIRKVDAVTNMISTFAGNGVSSTSNNAPNGDGGSATAATFNYLTECTVDSKGNVYLVAANNNKVRKIDGETKVISTVVGSGVQSGSGGDGGPATSAAIKLPYSLHLDATGNLFVSEYNGYRVRRVGSDSGIITTYAGIGQQGYSGDGGRASSAKLSGVSMVAGDAKGNLFIAGSNRVRAVDAVSTAINTIAGTGVAGYSGNGGAATSAEFNGIQQLFAHGDRIYLPESGNNVVRLLECSTAPEPSPQPTVEPSSAPMTGTPTVSPNCEPTLLPTEMPTEAPMKQVSSPPSSGPSFTPTISHSTNEPTSEPTSDSTSVSPVTDSQSPSAKPSQLPSQTPSTDAPTSLPSEMLSLEPSFEPSAEPSMVPSLDPSAEPSMVPSLDPSVEPTLTPSETPSLQPSSEPTWAPTAAPVTSITFNSTLLLYNVSVTVLDEACQSAVLSAVASTVNVDIDQVRLVAQTLVNRSSSAEATAGYEVQVVVNIIASTATDSNNNITATQNSTELYQEIVSLLTTAVATDEFLGTVRNVSATLNAAGTLYVSRVNVTVSDFSAVLFPANESGSTGDVFGRGVFIAVVIGILLSVLMAVLLCYYILRFESTSQSQSCVRGSKVPLQHPPPPEPLDLWLQIKSFEGKDLEQQSGVNCGAGIGAGTGGGAGGAVGEQCEEGVEMESRDAKWRVYV